MGYSFWTPPIEQRQYVDVGNFFAGIGAGQAEQQGKARNKLLEAEIGQMPTRNALLQEQLAGAQTTNESNRLAILQAKQAEFARKLSEDDPGTIREQIEEGLTSGVILKPPSIGGVPFDKWNPDQYKKYARTAKMQGLSLEKQIEMKQPGYGLTGDFQNIANVTGKSGKDLIPEIAAFKKQTQKDAAPSELTKLITERDSLDPSDPNRDEYEKRIRNLTAGMPTFAGVPTAEGVAIINTKNGQIVQTGQKRPMPAEMVVAEQQIGTLRDTMERIRGTYKEDYVGPVGGRYGQAMGEWVGLPQEQAEFYADVAQINNTLIYLMSGKQINESEYERLKKQLPSANLPPSTFMARMDAFEKTVDSIVENRKENTGAYKKTEEQKKSKNETGIQFAPETKHLPTSLQLSEQDIAELMKTHKSTRQKIIDAYMKKIGK